MLALSVESNAFRAISDVVVYTPDHAGLFSKLAGAIAVSGGSIVDAKAFTTTDGFALDVFSVQDQEGGPFGDGARTERLRQTIAKTLAGQMLPKKALAKKKLKQRATAFQVRPKVNFDNDASAIATVVEVEGLDRPGLLYDVTHAIFQSGLSISVVDGGDLWRAGHRRLLCARWLRPQDHPSRPAGGGQDAAAEGAGASDRAPPRLETGRIAGSAQLFARKRFPLACPLRLRA